MPKIPDRWLDYCNFRELIAGTRFIAFKVPLNENLCRNAPSSKQWTPSMAIKDIPRLGMVIDLTNTSRYYQPQVFKDKNIEYLKIMCEGHGRLPGLQLFEGFFNGVDDFLKNGKNKGQVIGVHCTHGLNRTGLFICKYMIDRMGYKPAHAIAAFNQARGHQIERREYLDALARGDEAFSSYAGSYSRRAEPEKHRNDVGNSHHTPRNTFNKTPESSFRNNLPLNDQVVNYGQVDYRTTSSHPEPRKPYSENQVNHEPMQGYPPVSKDPQMLGLVQEFQTLGSYRENGPPSCVNDRPVREHSNVVPMHAGREFTSRRSLPEAGVSTKNRDDSLRYAHQSSHRSSDSRPTPYDVRGESRSGRSQNMGDTRRKESLYREANSSRSSLTYGEYKRSQSADTARRGDRTNGSGHVKNSRSDFQGESFASPVVASSLKNFDYIFVDQSKSSPYQRNDERVVSPAVSNREGAVVDRRNLPYNRHSFSEPSREYWRPTIETGSTDNRASENSPKVRERAYNTYQGSVSIPRSYATSESQDVGISRSGKGEKNTPSYRRTNRHPTDRY